ncbi:MAG: cytochrome c oxidase subunit II [Pseudomonadota bacterium]
MHGPIQRLVRKTFLAPSASLLALVLGSAGAAHAAKPEPWQWWHQPAASPGMEAIIAFDIWTLWFIVPITLFVLGLLAYVMIKFRASANPNPSDVTHNTTVEVVWTLAPVVILIALAIPSFQLLSAQFNPPEEPSVTIKATGYQWYWGYEYQDDSEIAFDSRPIGVAEIAGDDEKAQAERVSLGKEDLSEYPRLLAVDNEMVVPVGKVVRVLVTAGDVIHNFALPAFGLKMDGYPGRLNETFFQPTKEGLYYGQCSELCGKFHAYMPIAIRVVSEADYATWANAAKSDVDAANRALQATLKERKKNVDVAASE